MEENAIVFQRLLINKPLWYLQISNTCGILVPVSIHNQKDCLVHIASTMFVTHGIPSFF